MQLILAISLRNPCPKKMPLPEMNIFTVRGADVRAVLYALLDVSIDNLSNGTFIRLGDLGSLRPGLSSEGRKTGEEENANAVKNASVLFTPGTCK